MIISVKQELEDEACLQKKKVKYISVCICQKLLHTLSVSILYFSTGQILSFTLDFEL